MTSKLIAVCKGKTDYMLVFDKEDGIRTMQPNLPVIVRLEARGGGVVTARGHEYDFVSRFFAPAAGVNEDPVCGAAHSTFISYWAEQLNQAKWLVYPLSECGRHFIAAC